MTSYKFLFETGQKTTRATWYPNFLGNKNTLGFYTSFYDAMWYDPAKYPQLNNKLNVLWGYMYRGGILSYDANVVYFGWKPSKTKNKFELWANVCTHITDAPQSFKLMDVETRQRYLLKFFKTEYYAFDVCDYTNKSLSFYQTEIEGISYKYGYRWNPTIELLNGAPQRMDLKFDEVGIDLQGRVTG